MTEQHDVSSVRECGQITYSIREEEHTGLRIHPEMQFYIKEGDSETKWYSVQMILDAAKNFGDEMLDRYKSDRNYHNSETQVRVRGFANVKEET